MDIFKLLSRSTGLNKGAKPSTNSQSLPSAGQNANPQIFGATRGGDTLNGESKKKTAIPFLATEASGLPTELAYTRENRKRKRKGGSEGVDGTSKSAKSAVPASNGNTSALAEQEEKEEADSVEYRKRTLRSHKIKVTTMSAPASADTKKKKSSTKKAKVSEQNLSGEIKTTMYPRPLTAFSQLSERYQISRRLAQNIQEQGYKIPTEVQLASLPILLGGDLASDAIGEDAAEYAEGVHLLSVAPTGSGKTLAFLIPVIQSLVQQRAQKTASANDTAQPEEGPQAIVVAPTRELANQIVNEARKLVANTGIKVALVRKGMRVQGQATPEANSKGDEKDSESEEESNEEDSDIETTEAAKTIVKSDILVSTPLTLLHAIQTQDKTSSIPTIRHLILDEADVLLDPLFRSQTMSIWSACTNPSLRLTLWSATMPSSIETLILETLGASNSPLPILRLVVGLKDTSLPTITHSLTYAATEPGKLLAIRQLLHPTSASTDSQGRKSLRPPFLVFAQTIERAIALHAELKFDIPPEAGGSSRIAVLHSGLSESSRSKIMTSFRKGEVWVIITTDLLARGVDFRGLNGVVNYDVPTSAAAYVHRVGRTGRAGRQGGVAVTLYTKEDIPYIKAIANVIAASEKQKGGDAGANSAGGNGTGSGIQQWMLDALPTPSKRDKQDLKRRGVESRRKGFSVGSEGRISTKSSYDRRNENKRREAREGAVRRKEKGAERGGKGVGTVDDGDFEGFD